MVWQALDMEMLTSAEFVCEQLLALDKKDPSSLHLMGLVLYRQGKYHSAMKLTGSIRHTGCIYIYARCCLKTRYFYKGILAIQNSQETWADRAPVRASDTTRCFEPDTRAIQTVYGQLLRAQGQKDKAVTKFADAICCNPYLWEPIEALAQMGVPIQAKNVFRPELVDLGLPPGVGAEEIASQDPFSSSSNAPSSSSSSNSASLFTFKTGQKFLRSSKANSDLFSTPTGTGTEENQFTTPTDAARSRIGTLPLAPQKRTARNLSSMASADKVEIPKRQLRSTQARRQQQQQQQQQQLPQQQQQSQKNSGRTGKSRHGSSNDANNTTNTNTTNANGVSAIFKRPGGSTQTNGSTNAPPPKLAKSDINESSTREAEKYISSLFSSLTSAYTMFCKYDCDGALQVLHSLPENHRETPWVLSKIGRAYFEKVSYSKAEEVFKRLRKLDKFRTEDMEYYSTLLWHLRREIDLGYLAYELIDVDKTSPQAWCALGNSFSLQRDTEQALQCFKRAIQLDPYSPYAYTLQAHEHVANDAYENAQESFRQAIKVDNRHYNAWYGLGMVYMRLGSTVTAEAHFTKALSINPVNVVLICCLGMVQERFGSPEKALVEYNKACELQPTSALSRYKKARALIQLRRYDEALEELKVLRTLAPEEASVHFMLGQLYKIMHNRDLAIKHFTIALTLDPKGSHLIKDALEKLNED
ncbi:anaphase-promoting complex subunit Cdc27p [Trichomonascus vanleenenianus]|uniref:anaphase promoting complex subunit CDC27 n=1 Tax=Trichomonascus vanleenenianus TaxID=2268995 RepID=UPI003ECB8E9B